MSEDTKKELLNKLSMLVNHCGFAAQNANLNNESAWIRHEKAAEALLHDIREIIISA